MIMTTAESSSMKNGRSLHIALISTDYPPMCTSAAVQMRDLANEMRRQGHEPIVIIPTVNLAKVWQTELMDGVTILRSLAQQTI